MTATQTPTTSPLPPGLVRWLGTKGLTPRQGELTAWFCAYHAKHGYAPTIAEWANAFDVSKVSIFENVAALVRKGVLGRHKFQSRGLYLRWPPDANLAIENTRLRAALRHYAEQEVGGEVAQEALEAVDADGRE